MMPSPYRPNPRTDALNALRRTIIDVTKARGALEALPEAELSARDILVIQNCTKILKLAEEALVHLPGVFSACG